MALAPATGSVQQLLPVTGVSGDVLVLRDGTACGVVEARPVNFAFSSPEDQTAMLAGLFRFFHGLRYPIVILVRSVPADIDGYLRQLRRPDLPQHLAALALDHDAFVRELAHYQRPLTRSRYILVPSAAGPALDPALRNPVAGAAAVAAALLARLRPQPAAAAPPPRTAPEQARRVVEQRCREIETALAAVRIPARRLGNEELLQLLRSAFRPAGGAAAIHAVPVQPGRPAPAARR